MSAGKDVFGDRPAEGPPQPFFHSRWVPAPAHVRDLGPEVGLPRRFRAAGVACGIKPSGRRDLGLLVCDAENPVSAARFTDTGTPAAPVLLTQERCKLGALRVILANAGCANAATGRRGLDDAAKTQGAAAIAAGVGEEAVAVASTGGISQYLPVDRMLKGILAANGELRREGDGDFQQAIQTTDAFEKRACLEVELSGGPVRLTAQCKGAGMISPRFATMFCFVQTDAELAPETAELLFGVCVKRSFDRVSVDGQLSTNDTAILMCSGASGVKVAAESEDELRFGEALDALLRQLAIMMVADGEGAARIARVRRARRSTRGRRGGGALGRQFAAREGRAAQRRPELGPDRPGRRRGDAGDGAVRCGHHVGGNSRVLGGHVDRLRRRCVGAGVESEGSRIRDHASGRRRRDRGVFLRPIS